MSRTMYDNNQKEEEEEEVIALATGQKQQEIQRRICYVPHSLCD